jgi:4-amino-4-deoxy-L-arabinose transferase-like glycosyltransferase
VLATARPRRELPCSRRRSRWTGPVAILAVALGVRLLLVLLTSRHYVPIIDDADYSRIAASIASDHGFGNAILPYMHGPSAFRPPLYPAVLALTYVVTGVHWTAGRIENAIIGTLAVAAIGALGAELWDRRTGLVAMGLAAIFPPLLLASYGLGYEALLVALLCATLICLLRAERAADPLRWLLGAGALAGFALLTRETAAALLPLLAIVAWRRGGTLRARVARAIAVLLTVVAVVAPWTIRNAVRLHAFVPVSTGLGAALEGSYNRTSPDGPGGPAIWVPPWSDPATLHQARALADPTEVRAEHLFFHLASTYIEEHPAYVAEVAAWNTIRLFDLRGPHDADLTAPWIPYPRRLVDVAVFTGYLIDLLVVIGCWTRRVRDVPVSFWITPAILFLGLIVVSGNIRYRAVLEPFLILVAAAALVEGHERYINRAAIT